LQDHSPHADESRHDIKGRAVGGARVPVSGMEFVGVGQKPPGEVARQEARGFARITAVFHHRHEKARQIPLTSGAKHPQRAMPLWVIGG